MITPYKPKSGLKSFHPNEITRAARIGWNALSTLAKDETLDLATRNHIGLILDTMNRKGVFDKPGTVLSGPIPGDIAGSYVTLADIQKYLDKIAEKECEPDPTPKSE
jgi:hypothetical protein